MPLRSFLRTPSEHGHHRVTYVELLFDLVFVFAITQLSHLLIEHFSLATAGQALLLLLAVWWVWIFTAWVTNWIDPEQLPVRALLLARLAYTYIHILLVAGIVVSAVGDEFTLVHPAGHTDAKTVIAVLGGTAIYLAGNLLFKWTILGKISYSHLTSIAVLGAVVLAADYLTPLTMMTMTSLVLVVLVMVEERSRPSTLPPHARKGISS